MGRQLGVAVLHERRPAYFTPALRANLAVVAAQAAVLLDHRRLHDAEQRQAGQRQAASVSGGSAVLDTLGPGTLQAVLDGVPCAVLIADAVSGEVLLWNRAADNFGNPLVRPTERWTLVRPTGRPFSAEELPLARAARSGQTVTGAEAIITRCDGTPVPVVASAAPLYTSSGALSAVMAVFLDASQRTELDRLKNVFLADLRHELNTPLTSVTGFIQLAQRRLARSDNQQVRAILAQAARGADRLSALVASLLDVSRLQTGLLELRREEVEMGALLARVAESLQGTTDLHHLEVRTAPAPLSVLGDAERLEEVLVSLVKNAITYAPRGGPIALRAHRVDDQIVVSIADRGTGIADGEQERVFEPFYRGQNAVVAAHGGLGMGLHISRQIVEWHDGRMWMQSKLDQGSTFFFSLPALSQHPSDLLSPRAPQWRPALPGVRP
jgi:signal transduction histidine kinase